MKLFSITFLMALFTLCFSSFTEENEIALKFAKNIVNNEISLKDFMAIQSLETTDPLARFISCEIFIAPPKSSGRDAKEFSINNVNLADQKAFKEASKQILSGTKVYFDEIKILTSKGERIQLKPIIMLVK